MSVTEHEALQPHRKGKNGCSWPWVKYGKWDGKCQRVNRKDYWKQKGKNQDQASRRAGSKKLSPGRCVKDEKVKACLWTK